MFKIDLKLIIYSGLFKLNNSQIENAILETHFYMFLYFGPYYIYLYIYVYRYIGVYA